jgi:hypothetical protein
MKGQATCYKHVQILYKSFVLNSSSGVFYTVLSIVEKKIKEAHFRAITFNPTITSPVLLILRVLLLPRGGGIIPQGMSSGKEHYRTKV